MISSMTSSSVMIPTTGPTRDCVRRSMRRRRGDMLGEGSGVSVARAPPTLLLRRRSLRSLRCSSERSWTRRRSCRGRFSASSSEEEEDDEEEVSRSQRDKRRRAAMSDSESEAESEDKAEEEEEDEKKDRDSEGDDSDHGEGEDVEEDEDEEEQDEAVPRRRSTRIQILQIKRTEELLNAEREDRLRRRRSRAQEDTSYLISPYGQNSEELTAGRAERAKRRARLRGQDVEEEESEEAEESESEVEAEEEDSESEAEEEEEDSSDVSDGPRRGIRASARLRKLKASTVRRSARQIAIKVAQDRKSRRAHRRAHRRMLRDGLETASRRTRSVARAEIELAEASSDESDASNESESSAPTDANDAFCFICGKGGDLLCCDGPCLHSFHLRCLGLDNNPEDDPWFCEECQMKRACGLFDGNPVRTRRESPAAPPSPLPQTVVFGELSLKDRVRILSILAQELVTTAAARGYIDDCLLQAQQSKKDRVTKEADLKKALAEAAHTWREQVNLVAGLEQQFKEMEKGATRSRAVPALREFSGKIEQARKEQERLFHIYQHTRDAHIAARAKLREEGEKKRPACPVGVEPLGFDRFFNQYLLFPRDRARLYVVSQEDRWGYYDKPEQIYTLIRWLDERGHREQALKHELEDLAPEIIREMTHPKRAQYLTRRRSSRLVGRLL
eukprot:gnl/Trimastix_PCT/2900.p1 GENE.gnl/Trimastix_PCT/2900~~gnl/Trimastix_PCT/2900.p1  ORF type:complete len:675 (+),score=206.08 gnl/Trimastix_PCT/2900:1340-3364(+)